MSELTMEKFPAAPDHPHAMAVERELRAVQVLAARWVWEIYRSGALSAVVVSHLDGTTVRVLVHDEFVEVEAIAGYAPLQVHALAALLMHNHSRAYKARAGQPEDGEVPIYVVARFGHSALSRLGEHLWDAFEEGFMWRGEINRLRTLYAGFREGRVLPGAEA